MPKNQGTSRKGKPSRQDRAAGMGRALQKAQGHRYTPKANGTSRGEGGMIMPEGVQSIGMDAYNVDDPRHKTMTSKSILELTDLDDFLLQADLANREFISEKERMIVLDTTGHAYRPGTSNTVSTLYGTTSSSGNDTNNHHDPTNNTTPNFVFQELSVPRRPQWDTNTTPEELKRMEQETFLHWRRGIATWEEQIAARNDTLGGASSVTPFEKNLEVWRQLWRVLERSSCLLQIVDARNPLFYLSDDLRDYATSLGKPMMCLINKADYLSPYQRQLWYQYLHEKGWEPVFFSAIQEQNKLDAIAQQQRKLERRQNQQQQHRAVSDAILPVGEIGERKDDEDEVDGKEGNSNVEQRDGERDVDERLELDDSDDELDHGHHPEQISQDGYGIDIPLSRRQLMETMLNFARQQNCEPDSRYDNRIQFGMVGFPNVGKSSVINVLIGSSKHTHGLQRVAVASQPGKTKHFQTLLLPDMDEVMLCDCPGLVFPSFVSNTADLIAAGVYPIAQMRDHWPVIQLICHRIPREIINALYGIHIPVPTLQEMNERGLSTIPPPTAEEFLGTYCIARGLLAASSGIPDYAKAARIVIKDYAEGKLLYCHPAPGVNDTETFYQDTISTALNNTTRLREKLLQRAERQQQHHHHPGQPNGGVSNLTEFTDEELLEFIGEGTAAEVLLASQSGQLTTARSGRKWGKKDRKNRNKDPYGCHSTPDTMMMMSTVSNGPGVVVQAGKYTHGGYTRPNGYAGVRNGTSTRETN